MGEFDDLIGESIPDREPTAPEEDDEPLPAPPADTRSQRRAYKAHVAAQLKDEGCTCQRPFPKIRFVNDEEAPEGAVPMQSEHQPTCVWLRRLRAGTN